MTGNFAKGAELDKQIYKEGEPTWGCKSGVLDVEDVKGAVEDLKERLKHIRGCGKSCQEGFADAFHCGDGHLCWDCEYPINKEIKEIFGEGLI